MRNGHFRWKRTSRRAEFDLSIDPIDEAGEVPDWCSVVYLPLVKAATPTDILRVGTAAASAARRDFDRVGSVSDLISIFSERASMSFRRFSLENYTQTHLAWGLALIALGESAAGEAHLKRFCDQFGLDHWHRLIQKGASEAAKYA